MNPEGKGRPPLYTPALAADAIVVRRGRVLLIQRRNPPFAGGWALPGGFVERGESVETAVLRELREETGLSGRSPRLVGVYSDPRRDERGHVVSVAFRVPVLHGQPHRGSDAREARWWPLANLPFLAFDHGRILQDALRRSPERPRRARGGPG